MHQCFCKLLMCYQYFLKKKTSTLQIFSVDDSLRSRLGKYSIVKQNCNIDTMGTIRNVPYENIQLQISGVIWHYPKEIIENYSSAQQTVLFYIIAIFLAVIVFIQAHFPKFVLQTDKANKELAGCFANLQIPSIPQVKSSHGLSSHFTFLCAFQIEFLLSNTIYQHTMQIFVSSFTGRPTLFTFSFSTRWTKKCTYIEIISPGSFVVKNQRFQQRWLYRKIYKTEMKFWTVLCRRGCREKKISQLS